MAAERPIKKKKIINRSRSNTNTNDEAIPDKETENGNVDPGTVVIKEGVINDSLEYAAESVSV